MLQSTRQSVRSFPVHAVKILHNIFQEDPDVNTLAEGFNRECEYLKSIRHPNIVQYLGLCRDPQTHHPALLMELLELDTIS